MQDLSAILFGVFVGFVLSIIIDIFIEEREGNKDEW